MKNTMELYIKQKNMTEAASDVHNAGANVINCIEFTKDTIILIIEKNNADKKELLKIGFKYFK
jgi:hypothetical protein